MGLNVTHCKNHTADSYARTRRIIKRGKLEEVIFHFKCSVCGKFYRREYRLKDTRDLGTLISSKVVEKREG